MTSFATGVTAHALTVELPEVAPELPEPELPEVVLMADELADQVVQPPTTSAATSATHGDHRREAVRAPTQSHRLPVSQSHDR